MSGMSSLAVLLLLLLVLEITAWQLPTHKLHRGCQVSGKTCSSRKVNTALHAWNFNFGNKSPAKTVAKKQARGLPLSPSEAEKIYELWMKDGGKLPTTSPNFLNQEQVLERTAILAEAMGSVDLAIQLLQVDTTILTYRIDGVVESFQAWTTKLGSREEVVKLCIRNPPVLSIKPLFIQRAGQPDIAQTYFWSYVAVALRPLGSVLQLLFQPLTRL